MSNHSLEPVEQRTMYENSFIMSIILFQNWYAWHDNLNLQVVHIIWKLVLPGAYYEFWVSLRKNEKVLWLYNYYYKSLITYNSWKKLIDD